VFPRRGVNLSVGQTLPYATDWTGPAPEPTPVLAQAVAPGTCPYIFNNDGPDGSFAVQTPIDLWDVSLGGKPLGTVHVPTHEMTTNFSSKSELAINVSTDDQTLSFSGSTAGSESFVTVRKPIAGVRYGGVAVIPSDFGSKHGSLK
jgi:hypothetical protein